MINQYDKTAALNIQPYNWDLLNLAGSTTQKRADEVDEDAYKLQSLIGSVNAIDQHKEYKKQLDDWAYGKLNKVYETMKKGNTNAARREIMQAGIDFQRNPLRQELEQSYDIYNKQYLPSVQKMKEAGTYADVYGNPYANFQGKQESGEINPFRYKGMLNKEDYGENAQSLVAGIAKDSRVWEGYAKYPKGHPLEGQPMVNQFNQLIKQDGKTEGIDLDKIQLVARANAEALVRGKGGRYFVDETLGKPVNFDYLAPEEKQAVIERGTKLLSQLALKQLTLNTASGVDLQNLPEYLSKQDDSGTGIQTLSGSLRKRNVTANLNLDDLTSGLKFNPDGSIKESIIQKPVPQIPDKTTIQNMPGYSTGVALAKGFVNNMTQNIDAKPEAEAYLRGIREKNPSLANVSDEEAVGIITDATKSLSNSTSTQLKLDETMSKSIQAQVFGPDGYGDLADRNIYLINSDGSQSQRNYKDVASKLGYGDNIPKDALKKAKITGIDVDGEDAGNYIAVIPNKKGDPVNLIIQSNDQVKKMASVSGAANSLLYSGGGEASIEVGNGIVAHVEVKNNLNVKNRTYDPKVTISYIKDGQIIEQDKDLTLSEVYNETAIGVDKLLRKKK